MAEYGGGAGKRKRASAALFALQMAIVWLPHVLWRALGAPLARIEGEISIRTVIERLPNLRLDTNSVEWAEGTIFRIPMELAVSF